MGTAQEARQSLLYAVDRHMNVAGSDCTIRTDAERQRLPRDLQRLLAELRKAGVEGQSETALREALLSEHNSKNQIPDWLCG